MSWWISIPVSSSPRWDDGEECFVHSVWQDGMQLHFPTVVTGLMMSNLCPSSPCVTPPSVTCTSWPFYVNYLYSLSQDLLLGESRPTYASSTILCHQRLDWDFASINESQLKWVVCYLSYMKQCYHFTWINCQVFSSISFLYIPALLCHVAFSISSTHNAWNRMPCVRSMRNMK